VGVEERFCLCMSQARVYIRRKRDCRVYVKKKGYANRSVVDMTRERLIERLLDVKEVFGLRQWLSSYEGNSILDILYTFWLNTMT
jgi:hypothetical protein